MSKFKNDQVTINCPNCNEKITVTKDEINNQDTLWITCECCSLEVEIEVEYVDDEPIDVYIY